MKKNALGRGLDALLPELDVSGRVSELPVLDIDPNAAQPRRHFEQQSLQELADSIHQMGVLQPILVTRHKNRYRIIAGERRFRAARLAGLATVPCVVRELSSQQQLEAALVENIQREDLNPLEAAAAIRSLMEAGNLSQEEVARRLGKSRPAVANLLRLLSLPKGIADLVLAGELTEGHARALAGVADEKRQQALALKIIGEHLNVRQAEALCAQNSAQPHHSPAPARAAEMAQFEQDMLQAFGVRARIKGTLNRGQVTLPYHSRQELDAIYEAVEKLLSK